jgi:hypothetical protein
MAVPTTRTTRTTGVPVVAARAFLSGNTGCPVDGTGATQECSCTVPGVYFSSSESGTPSSVSSLVFDGSGGIIDRKDNMRYYVRAVRGGP